MFKMKKLTRLLLLGFVLVFLCFLSNPLQKGPQIVNAQVFDDGISPPGVIDDGISPPGVIDDGITPPQSQPSGGSSGGGGQCPAQGCPGGNPPPVSCPESREQYPQCGGTSGLQNFPATDTIMVTRVKDCKGNIIRYENQNLGNLGQCQQAAPPAAPPAACFIGKSCTCSGASAGNCDQCSGGWCNGGVCSTCSAAPAVPATPPQQPNAPSCPGDYKICPDGSAVSRNPGDGCNFFACPNVPRPVSCTPQITQENSCVGVQLCAVNVTRNSDCTISRSNPFNCQNSASCGFVTPSACTPSTTQESSCFGNQLCSFNNNRFSDCSSSRTGPFNCQLIAGQCGFNPGSTCTPASAAQSICVNAQLCTVNVSRNSDCTISRSGPFNCQNSAQCGFSTPPAVPVVGGPPAPVTITNTVNNPPATTVVQSFGNVGVGQTVYTSGVQGVQYATALPKTGLSLLAWATGAFLPAGFGLRRFKKIKKELEGDGSFLWEEREYKRS